MSECLAVHWREGSFGVVCESLIADEAFLARVLFAGGLVLAIYFLMVNAVGDAGLDGTTRIAAFSLLGACIGCLVRKRARFALPADEAP